MNPPEPVATQADDLSALLRHLDIAARYLRRARAYIAWNQFLSRMPVIVALAMLTIAIEIALIHLVGSTFDLIPWTVATSSLAAVAVLIYFISRRPRADWREVAERLDLAASDHNAIATALDLLQYPQSTGLAALAITDGIKAAMVSHSLRPMIEKPSIRMRRSLWLLTGGLLALVAALFLPNRVTTQKHTLTPPNSSTAIASSRSGLDIPGFASLKPTDTITVSNQTIRQAITPAGKVAAPSDRLPGESARVGANTNASSATGGNSAATSGLAGGPSPPAAPHTSPVGDTAAAQTGAGRVSAATLGTASSDTASAQQLVGGGADGESALSDSQPAHSTRQNGASGGAGSKLPPDKSKSGGAGSDSAIGTPKQSKHAGAGSEQGNQGPGGNGQSGGQSPPKKSRSVAPLMLGFRQPDLLQGRQMAGPDERVTLQVPPQPDPQSPDAAIDAPSREVSESPVDVYAVPPVSRSAVTRYFQQFHQDLAPDTVNSN
jgi:hypothetical protein